MAMTCPSCKRAFALESHPDGRCEEVNRGRRFFMMGALALPVAQKVTLAPEALALPADVYRYWLTAELVRDLTFYPAALSWTVRAVRIGE